MASWELDFGGFSNYHLQSHSPLPETPGRGPLGHVARSCNHSALAMTELLHSPAFFTLSLLEAWRLPSPAPHSDTSPSRRLGPPRPGSWTLRGESWKTQVLPLGSLYSRRGDRVHIWTCLKNTCKAEYRQVQINVVWTSCWLQPTRGRIWFHVCDAIKLFFFL